MDDKKTLSARIDALEKSVKRVDSLEKEFKEFSICINQHFEALMFLADQIIEEVNAQEKTIQEQDKTIRSLDSDIQKSKQIIEILCKSNVSIKTTTSALLNKICTAIDSINKLGN